MTALISNTRAAGAATTAAGVLLGFAALASREITEWRRARRTRVVLVASALFLMFGSLNSWLLRQLPAEPGDSKPLPSLEPLSNLAGPVSAHVFVVIAVFAVMALMSAERESGTLAWTASKPVSRSAIWLSKFAVATAVLWFTAGLLPLAAAVAVVGVLYGMVPLPTVLAIVAGMGMAIALFVAVSLAASTLVTSQAAVAAITFTVMSVGPMLAQALPDPTLMPTAILLWSINVGVGEPASPLSLIGWAVTMIALVTFSLRRMERLEL